jgi:hygromycin-B 7''-O-kinase
VRASGPPAPQSIDAATPGTHAVLRVDGPPALAVKFYGPFWPDEWAKDVELYGLLGKRPDLLTPTLVASGHLPTDLAGAGGRSWPYTVSTWLPGQPVGSVWPELARCDRLRLALELGQLLRLLHAVPPERLRSVSAAPEDWGAFIKHQAQGAADRHEGWGVLPARLLDQVPSFLAHPRALPALGGSGVRLLNCDVTADHVLLSKGDGREAGAGRGWRITGLIDFGDAMCGEPEYEFAAVLLSALGGDVEAGAAFLQAYGYRPPAGVSAGERLLAYALLHRFDVFGGLEGPPREAVMRAASLPELALRLWEG